MLGIYYLINLFSSATTLFDIPSSSTGLTILQGCVAGQALVTGTGSYETRSCKQGAAAVSDRYQSYSILRDADNTGSLGVRARAWMQVAAYIHHIRNYCEFQEVATPSNPSTSRGRLYVRAIDANNNGLFIKIKKAGAISEVQIA